MDSRSVSLMPGEENPTAEGKAKRRHHCTLCKVHGETVRKKGHQCPHKNCVCILCELTRKAQKTMRHQQRVWRYQKQRLKKGTDDSEQKQQDCCKCRNHNILTRKRNHTCPYANCQCDYCTLTYKRREIMKHQQRVRRANFISQPAATREKEPGGPDVQEAEDAEAHGSGSSSQPHPFQNCEEELSTKDEANLNTDNIYFGDSVDRASSPIGPSVQDEVSPSMFKEDLIVAQQDLKKFSKLSLLNYSNKASHSWSDMSTNDTPQSPHISEEQETCTSDDLQDYETCSNVEFNFLQRYSSEHLLEDSSPEDATPSSVHPFRQLCYPSIGQHLPASWSASVQAEMYVPSTPSRILTSSSYLTCSTEDFQGVETMSAQHITRTLTCKQNRFPLGRTASVLCVPNVHTSQTTLPSRGIDQMEHSQDVFFRGPFSSCLRYPELVRKLDDHVRRWSNDPVTDQTALSLSTKANIDQHQHPVRPRPINVTQLQTYGWPPLMFPFRSVWPST